MGSPSISRRGRRPDRRRSARAELGAATRGQTRRRRLVRRFAGAGLERARGCRPGAWRPGRSAGLDTTLCASSCSAHVGCSYTRRPSLSDLAGRADMGRRAACTPACPCARAIMGCLAVGGSSCANMGLARPRAERRRAASNTILGSAQAFRAGTRGGPSSTVMGSPRAGRPRQRASTFLELARSTFMGLAPEHIEATRFRVV